jgi:hypothetical protein
MVRSLNVNDLVAAFNLIKQADIIRNARLMGERIRAEDGVGVAVKSVYYELAPNVKPVSSFAYDSDDYSMEEHYSKARKMQVKSLRETYKTTSSDYSSSDDESYERKADKTVQLLEPFLRENFFHAPQTDPFHVDADNGFEDIIFPIDIVESKIAGEEKPGKGSAGIYPSGSKTRERKLSTGSQSRKAKEDKDWTYLNSKTSKG